jgi:uroporphyrinogen III methyltransferase / synthase
VRVVVTGTEGKLAERLRAEGLDVHECPLVGIEPIDGPPIRAADYDWVVLTSRHAVGLFFGRCEGAVPKVAVIGPGTAEALREHGVEPALVARVSTQEGLLADLPQPAGRVLFAGAEGAREVLTRELDADFVPVYQTVELRPDALPEGDLAVIASPSAARGLAAIGASLPCVSIGPITSEEARRHGLDVAAEAATHDLEGLVQAVKLAASRAASSRS